MNKEQFRDLIQKVSDGEATDSELALYNRYYHAYQKNGEFWDEQQMGLKSIVYNKLKKRVYSQIKPAALVPFWKNPLRFTAAAVTLLVLSVGLVFFIKGVTGTDKQRIAQDVAPGGNKAILTLANGRRIELSDSLHGELAQQSGMSIRKTNDGRLVFTVIDSDISSDKTAKDANYTTVSTPLGGQYQVELPDGTRVWLNAASSIRFPTAFKNLKKRHVELKGEAYFEVVHKSAQPFVVSTIKQDITVLGTHFNISSYVDEPEVRTTLLQGAVLVRKTEHNSMNRNDKNFVLLKPGQQSKVSSALSVEDADIEMVTAWKDGNFLFNDTDLRSVMQQLARWYNVGVDYNNIPPDRYFTGFISRDVNLSKVLAMLEVTGRIKFEIEDKIIKVENLKE